MFDVQSVYFSGFAGLTRYFGMGTYTIIVGVRTINVNNHLLCGRLRALQDR